MVHTLFCWVALSFSQSELDDVLGKTALSKVGSKTFAPLSK